MHVIYLGRLTAVDPTFGNLSLSSIIGYLLCFCCMSIRLITESV
jgi:hypothetical protein